MSPSSQGFSLEFEGRQREYKVALAPGGGGGGGGKGGPRLDEVVVVLHPFKGDPAKSQARFAGLLKAGFDLVLPVGVEQSWNGGECCGEARKLGLDDVGFVNEVVQAHFSNSGKEVRAFVVGYSNGGFLTTRVVLKAATGADPRFRWVRGGVSVAGEVFDAREYALVSRDEAVPVPMMIIHSHGDEVVLYEGCCKPQACCCEILSPTCSSTDDAFVRWGALNKCGVGGEQQPRAVRTNFTSCRAHVGCAAPTVLCPFESELHRGSKQIQAQVKDFLCGVSGRCEHDVEWVGVSRSSFSEASVEEDVGVRSAAGRGPGQNILAVALGLVLAGAAVWMSRRVAARLRSANTSTSTSSMAWTGLRGGAEYVRVSTYEQAGG